MAAKTKEVKNRDYKPLKTEEEITEEYESKWDAGLIPDYNRMWDENLDVGNGSWVLIIRSIPVDPKAAPKLYGIYWGMPKEDRFGRQCCVVHTTEDVTLLNHEYSVISEEKLELYKQELQYQLHETTNTDIQPMDMKLIEQGRALCEEERDIIRALQLDGLSETQACEEYFLSRHTDRDNAHIWYYPSDEALAYIENIFGERR